MKKIYLLLFTIGFCLSTFVITKTVDAQIINLDCGTYTTSGSCGFARGAGDVIGNTCNGALTVCIPTFVCTRFQPYNAATGMPTGACGSVPDSCVQCGCSAACVAGGPCGNGVVDSSESCDDGNLTNGDGCSSTCSVEGSGGTCNNDSTCDSASGESNSSCPGDCPSGGGGGGVCSEPFTATSYSSSSISIVKGNNGVFAIGLNNSNFTPNSINMNPAMTPSTSVTINKRNSSGFVVGNPIAIPPGLSPTMINVEVVTNASTVAGIYTVTIPMVSQIDTDCTQSLTLTVQVTNPSATPAPTVDLKVNSQDTSAGVPLILAAGAPANMTWAVLNATSCTATQSAGSPGAWAGAKNSSSGSQSLSPMNVPNVHSYTLTCTGATGGTSADTVYVHPIVPVTSSSLTATPSSVAYNGASTITWNASGYTSCSVSPSGWTGTSGSQSSGALTTSRTYTLSCLPADANSSKSVTVNVGAAPAALPTITATPTSIPYNGASTITWSSTNATSCSVAPSGWTGTSGSQSSGALTTSRTYTVSCLPAGAGSNANVTVTVAPAPVGLSVVKSGQGTVIGSTNPVQTNISCGATCTATYEVGTIVTLTATPNTGRIFTGWGGTACSSFGRNPVCSFTISGATSVLVNFAVDPNFKEF